MTVRRGFLVGAALAALALPPPAGGYAETRKLTPGLTYTREVTWRSAGPLVLHILKGPRPGGLYALKPVLSQNLVTGRETVTAMQRRLSRGATLAGVNGDLFNWHTGHPSGIFVRSDVLFSRPQRRRSSLAIGSDGVLRVARVRLGASWRVAGFAAHRLHEFNRPLRDRGVSLVTPTWGGPTPGGRRVFEVVLDRVPAVRPGRTFTATVVRRRLGGGRPVRSGGGILQARGAGWKKLIAAEARRGRRVTLSIGLTPWWDPVRDAIGGGPVLVRDGKPVRNAHEEFSYWQLRPRHPRTAVGQLANGRVILVTADGGLGGSIGLGMAGLAREMARLGAVRAMALDAGGSSTMAFDRRLLNRPNSGAERAVADALMFFYYGVYVPPPRHASFSPNGDGVADVQRLRAKVVRRADVALDLVAPDGTVRWSKQAPRRRGTITKDFSGRRAAEGTWRWVVTATDRRGRTSRMARRFVVNNTLGFLTLSKERMRVRPRRGGRLVVSVRLTNPARFAITVRRKGRLVRRLYGSRRLEPGLYALVWNGKRAGGRVVRTGRYVVRVRAKNELGAVALGKPIAVRRVEPG